MEVNQYDTLQQAVNDLKKRGYAADFDFKDGQLHAMGVDEKFSPQDITIVEYHRFEGESEVDDMSVIYAIESKSGVKGTIVDAYGTYANPKLAEFIKNVEVKVED